MKQIYLISIIMSSFISCMAMKRSTSVAFPCGLSAQDAIIRHHQNNTLLAATNTLSSQLRSFSTHQNAALGDLKYLFVAGTLSSEGLSSLRKIISDSDYIALLALKAQIQNNNISAEEHEKIKQWQQALGNKYAKRFKQMLKHKEHTPPLTRTGTIIINPEIP